MSELGRDAEPSGTDESWFGQLTEKAVVGIYVIQDGVMAYVNPSLAHTFGYEPAEITGTLTPGDLIHPDDIGRVMSRITQRLTARDEEEPSAYRAVRKDGSEILIETYGHAGDFRGRPAILGTLADVTQRSRIEAALRASEERFRMMFEDAPIGVMLVEALTGRIREANTRSAVILGRTREDLVGLDWRATTPPEDLPEQAAVLEQLSGGQLSSVAIQKRYLRPDGSTVWANVTVAQLGSGDAANPHRIVMIEDVTERGRAEAALAQSQARLRSIIDGTTDAVYVKDAEGRYLEINRAAAEMTGRTHAEVLGRDDTALFAPDEAAAIMAVDRDAMARATPTTVEEVLTIGSGEVRTFLTTKGPVRDADGSPAALFGIARDITDRKAAERALRESEARFRSTLDQMFEGAALFAPDWRYLYVNEAAAGHGHARREDMLGRTLLEVYPGVETTEVFAAFRLAMEDRVPQRFEAQLTFPDGSSGDYAFSVEPVPDGIFVLSTDVTEHRRAEAEKAELEARLEQSQRLESIGRLAGGIAHDFNNMLGVILGNAELALGRVDPGQPLHADLVEIQKAARRSTELTRSLLAFARIQPAMPAVLDLNASVAGTLTMLTRLVGEDLHLSWQPGPDLWPVRVDPSQLDQVLANLCVNARDAVDGVGAVTIATANCVVDASLAAASEGAVPGDFVRLSVSDTGAGMPPDVLAHIFEPFYTTKPVGAGTGLGLSTVYGIVRQNEGFVTVVSRPGMGTTFDIYLARHAGDVAAADPDAGALPARGGRETILVVEDEPALLGLVVRVLERHGYVVLAAHGPAEAIRLSAQHPAGIDLLLTDMVMPGMDGQNLATLLRARRPGMRRVYMSGYPDRALSDEGARFIGKPFVVTDLAAMVRAALDEGQGS